jgi:hypothetical protein
MSTQSGPTLPEPPTWRELLATLIADPGERARIAADSGIGEVTLRRWAHNETNPRPYTLRPLVAALGQYEELLTRLILLEYPSFSPGERPQFVRREGQDDPEGKRTDETERIPNEVFERVLAIYTTTTDTLRLWTICKHILRAALQQLDPRRQGLSISIAQCLHCGEDGEEPWVHFLWERIELGTTTLRSELSQRMLFLGSESLAGYAVTSGLPAVSQNLRLDAALLPVRLEPLEESAVAFPLLRSGHLIAGCLLVTSTRPDFFTPGRLQLLEHYANLATLGFADADFTERGYIDLYPMADTPTQTRAFKDFRRRTLELMRSSTLKQQPLSLYQAEHAVRLQLSRELTAR